MREASCRVSVLVIDSMERRGYDVASTFEGVPLSRVALSNRESYVDWEPFAQWLTRVESVCGGHAAMENLFVSKGGIRTGHTYIGLARGIVSVGDAYRLLARWGIPRDIRCAQSKYVELDRWRKRFTIEIDERCIGSPEFLRFSRGVLASLPTLVGLPLAEVTIASLSSHAAVYELVLPADHSIGGKIRRAFEWFGGTAAVMNVLAEQTAEIREKNRQLEAKVREQERVEQDLREREAWLKLALEAGHVGIWSWNIDTDTIKWSEGVATIYGRPEGFTPSSGADYLNIIHPEDRDALVTALRRALAEEGKYDLSHRIVRGDDSLGWVHNRGQVVRDANGKAQRLTGTVVDISERKQLETQLLFADRMISAGTLAAGVAHEVNNPLAYVISNVEILREELERAQLDSQVEPRVRESLDAIADGSRRVRDVVRALNTFSRPQVDGREVIDLRNVIDAALRITSNELKHRAVLETDFDPETPTVLANESQLGQVFINLLTNALHAVAEAPDKGVIRVSLTRGPNGEAIAAVADNGVGIAADTMRRLFDPFFTTKPIGHGSGLGLAVCQSLVTAAGGRIVVDSELGRGSTFSVVLPACDAEPKAPTHAARTEPAKRSGRVLVIDDEAMLRKTIARVLETRGFEVVTACDGREGLAIALGPHDFSIVLCDLMMPEMTGMELYAELVQRRPDLARRTIFLTGGAFTPKAAEFLRESKVASLQKPFSLDTLVESIDRCLAMG